MSNMQKFTLGCVGMSHLGINHAAAFAEHGFSVICYDANNNLITDLALEKIHVEEPGLSALIRRNRKRLLFTNDVETLKNCDVVFIAQDVPTNNKGKSELSIIESLVTKVSKNINPNASVVLLSQVPPGFTRKLSLPQNKLFYQVETLIFGNAVHRALYPERYIVGALNPQEELPDAYRALLKAFDCPILPMSYESAELCKISINMFLVSTVTTTNVIAEVCENIGANFSEIADALKLDKRIGPYAYLKPGLGISGGNLERDLNTIVNIGEQNHTDVNTVKAWIANSQYRKNWAYKTIETCGLTTRTNTKICILGLAYKPHTHSVKNSPSIELIDKLKKANISVHDPVVKGFKNHNVTEHGSDIEACKDADAIVVMTPWPIYYDINIKELMTNMRGKIIIDPFGVLDGKIDSSFHYFMLGKKPNIPKNVEIKEQEYA